MKSMNLFPLLGLACLSVSCKDIEEHHRPNILFILSDDHAKSAISAYGGINAKLAPTPNIDRIASNGVLMSNMLCTNSISGPSRACLLTGKYSTVNGFYQNEGGMVFDGSQQQYQKLLQDAGYETTLFGKWHLFSEPQGFDYYMIHSNSNQQGTYWNPEFSINGERTDTLHGYATTLTADAAIEWLSSMRNPEKPFCMMLHFKAPHRPWEPDSCYLDLFSDIDFPHPETFDDDYSGREKTLGASMATIENHLTREDLKQIPPADLADKDRKAWLQWGGLGKSQYWSPSDTLKGKELKNWKFQTYIKDYLRVVRSVDDQVGKVLDYLEQNDLIENTIVIYMGDQGFYLGEHGLYDKRWMYEESLQMPCLISYPSKIKKGTVVDELALNIDIAPTLLDFAGVDIPDDIQGESMKGLLTGTASPDWRKSMYYQYFEYPLWHNVQPHYGVRTEKYKLIHYYYNIDEWELFDLSLDPNELHNLYTVPEYAALADSLKTELSHLQKQYGDTLSLKERRLLTDKAMRTYNDI